MNVFFLGCHIKKIFNVSCDYNVTNAFYTVSTIGHTMCYLTKRGMIDMKKKLGLIGAAILLIALVFQGTLAVFQESTNVNTKLKAAQLGVSIVLNDDTTKEAASHITFDNALPGANIKHDLKVRNTKNEDVYVRVTMTKYWENENGEKLVDADAKLIQLMSQWNDWIVVDDAANSNNEVMYFYYKKPLASQGISTSFLEQIICSNELSDKAYSQYQIKVDVEVDAIQTIGAEDAILSEWGMYASFDANGNIVSMDE